MSEKEDKIKQIEDRWTAATGYWEEWRKRASELRKLYDDGPEFTLKDSHGQNVENVVRPTIGADKPDAATEHIMGEVRIIIAPWSRAEGAQSQADAYERFMSNQIREAARSGTSSEIRGAVLEAQTVGLGILRVGADTSRYPPKPTKPNGATPDDSLEATIERWSEECEYISPIFVEAVDPLAFYGDPTTAGERWGFISYPRPLSDILEKHPELAKFYREEMGDDPETTVVWWREYHDDKWTAYDIMTTSQRLGEEDEPGEEPLLPMWSGDRRKMFLHYGAHAGFVPFSSGRGRIRGRPENRFVGLVDKAHRAGIVYAIAEIMTAAQVMAINGAWGALLKPAGTPDLRFGPGQQTEMPAEFIEKVRPIYPAQIPPQTIGYLDLLMRQFHSATLPALLETPDSPAGDAAYKLNIQIQQARTSLSGSTEAVTNALIRVCQHIHRLLKNPNIIDQDRPIRLFGAMPGRTPVEAEIRPRDLPEVIRLSVELRNTLPVDEGQRQRTGNEAVASGAISQEYNRQHFYQIDDAESESVQIGVEVIRKALLQQVIQEGRAWQWVQDYQAGKVDRTKTRFSQYVAAAIQAANAQAGEVPSQHPPMSAQGPETGAAAPPALGGVPS